MHILGIRKTLVAGCVPTEKLPTKSHEAPKRERRQLVRKVDPAVSATPPSASGYIEPQYSDIDEFSKQLGQKNIQPWKVEESSESNGEICISLDDKADSVPKYTVLVSPNLEFCVFAFNWPVPDYNTIYNVL